MRWIACSLNSMLLKNFPRSLKKNRNFLVFYEKSRLASFLKEGQIVLFIQRVSLSAALLAKWRAFFLTSFEKSIFQRSAAIFGPGSPLAPLSTTGHLALSFQDEASFFKALKFFAQQEPYPALVALCYQGIFLNLPHHPSPYVFLAEHARAHSLNQLRFCEKLLAYSFGFASFFFYFSYFSFFLIVLLNQSLALLLLAQNIFHLKQ